MGWIWLAIALAMGGLYVANKHCRSELAESETRASTAENRVKTYIVEAAAEEDARLRRNQQLAADQEKAATEHKVRRTAALAALKAGYTAREAKLKETLHAYVTTAADGRCRVPVGFVLWHDAALGGASPDEIGAFLSAPASRSIDADSGVKLSTVAETVGANYATADRAVGDCVSEVTAWRTWYPAEKARFTQP